MFIEKRYSTPYVATLDMKRTSYTLCFGKQVTYTLRIISYTNNFEEKGILHFRNTLLVYIFYVTVYTREGVQDRDTDHNISVCCFCCCSTLVTLFFNQNPLNYL